MKEARSRHDGERDQRRVLLAVAFVLGLIGAAAAFVVASHGTGLGEALRRIAPIPAAAAQEAQPGVIPGHYANLCLSGPLRGCMRRYIPPQLRPTFDADPRRSLGNRSAPQTTPLVPHAAEPQPDAPTPLGSSPGTSSNYGTRSYGSGYFDLPRPQEGG